MKHRIIYKWLDRVTIKPNVPYIYITSDIIFAMFCDDININEFTNIGYFIRALKRALKERPRKSIEVTDSIKVEGNIKRKHYVIFYNMSDSICHLKVISSEIRLNYSAVKPNAVKHP